MMTTQQILQITQIAFVLILFIPSLITIGVLIVIAWKFLPVMVRQVQQLIDNNTQLTKIAEQNTKQVEIQQQSNDKLSGAIENQTIQLKAELQAQSFDFRSYQTLVNEGMETHSSQLEANTARVNAFETILRAALEALPQQIVAAIDDKLKCPQILLDVQALRFEVATVLSQQQAKRITGSVPKVNNGGEETK